MRALIKKEAREGLWLEDIPTPEIGINDVLIKVQRTAICGTDLHIYNWNAWARQTIPVPMVVGHEFVGEIVDVGSNVNDFRPGQIVSGEGHVVCGRCRNCMAGRRHLCAHTSGIGVNRPGAFAEYLALPAANVLLGLHSISDGPTIPSCEPSFISRCDRRGRGTDRPPRRLGRDRPHRRPDRGDRRAARTGKTSRRRRGGERLDADTTSA